MAPTTQEIQPTRLSPEPTVHPTATVRDCHLGAWTDVRERAQLVEVMLGDWSYVMNDCDLMYCEVGKFTSIASRVRLNPSNHPIWRPTQHHFTYRSAHYYGLAETDDESVYEWRRSDAVRVGHDVWIGHGAMVLPGNTVGNGAVIGAGSVITHDVPPYSIVVGVPARMLRPRFPAHVAEAMERIRWWDWDHDRIKAALHHFRGSAENFVSRYDPR